MLRTGVSSLPLGLIPQGNSCARVDNSGLLDDETITVKASDIATRVSEGNLVDLVGVEPDLALSTFEDVCCQALLQFE